jgi:hypothetical protein
MSLELAIVQFIEARAEADSWQAVCIEWMKAHGRRHSHTYDKLARRRLSRHHLHFMRCRLIDALDEWCPFQNIMDEERRNPDVPTTSQRLVDLSRLVVQ